jgi:hypothetical protein
MTHSLDLEAYLEKVYSDYEIKRAGVAAVTARILESHPNTSTAVGLWLSGLSQVRRHNWPLF